MMRRAPRASAFCALLLTAACGARDSALPPLESAALVLPGFDSAVVALTDGAGERRDGSGTLVAEAGLTDWRAVGDFDVDGSTEAIVVVWSSGGGSGTFMDLALFTMEPGGWMSEASWRWRASRPLGDRVRVRALTVDGTLVEVHLTRHGPDDAMCCPTEQAVLRFRAEKGRLEELAPGEG
jgi:hypothetical protein